MIKTITILNSQRERERVIEEEREREEESIVNPSLLVILL
jgi:hypothetical protein